ncbi:hypothetical protein Zmor_012191 [Zophobas morio]|uniref:PTS EIIB type-1 domain-containing protein n=1 Tax=Zophobas morio TaxID=2755281 RepID=A0AA38HGB4_9CUCU|nr:hypothetical protein Zmor_012191 [Zophobas morio]
MKIKKDARATAQGIAELLPTDNVVSFTNCMTRLRVDVKDPEKVDVEGIKALDNVLGLMISNKQYQVILGPGFVMEVAAEFQKLTDVKRGKEISENLDEGNFDVDNVKAELSAKAKDTKNNFRSRTKQGVLDFFNKISMIFSPLVAGFIAAGLLQAVGSLILTCYPNSSSAHDPVGTA